jgi:vancomycin permeability regulator SanA
MPKTDRQSISKLVRAMIGMAIVCILPPAILVIDGLNDRIHKSDLAVVLGNKVELNGQPSPRLQARLDKTIELYHKGLFSRILVSGGAGSEGFDEAKVMKQYLIDRGLPAAQIYLDSLGNNTYLTAQHTAQMMNAQNLRSVMVISQYFHLPRTRLALNRMGIDQVYSAHADFFESRDFYSTAREVVGYGSYLFRTYEE